MKRLKVLVRQIATGLFWNGKLGWVQSRDAAEGFASGTEAIQYCVSKEMRDVELVLSFDDPAYDVVLHPFGERGHEPTSGELIERSRRANEQSKARAQCAKDLLAGAEESIAELKERKKGIPFKPKNRSGRSGNK